MGRSRRSAFNGVWDIATFCGNGSLDPDEECDDSNTASGDGCSSFCTLEVCGNGLLDFGEECDDGNTASGDGCGASCTSEILCGNAVLNPGEQCDDSNTASGDGCSSFCTLEVCGNGLLDAGEQCDDRNTASGDGCSATCIAEGPAPGRVPPTIRLGKAADFPASITVSWSASCAEGAPEYAIYEGTLGDWYSHTAVQCHDALGDLQEDLPTPAVSTYYLVVPFNPLGAEGSYGSSSFSPERPVGTSRCVTALDLTPCP